MAHSSNLRFPDWQPQYQAALIELNYSKLLGRVTEAERAIFQRLQSLGRIPNCESRFTELLAIENALSSLRLLKREQDFPDWSCFIWASASPTVSSPLPVLG